MMVPFVPVITNLIVGNQATCNRVSAVAEPCDVHVTPSGELSIATFSPTARNSVPDQATLCNLLVVGTECAVHEIPSADVSTCPPEALLPTTTNFVPDHTTLLPPPSGNLTVQLAPSVETNRRLYPDATNRVPDQATLRRTSVSPVLRTVHVVAPSEDTAVAPPRRGFPPTATRSVPAFAIANRLAVVPGGGVRFCHPPHPLVEAIRPRASTVTNWVPVHTMSYNGGWPHGSLVLHGVKSGLPGNVVHVAPSGEVAYPTSPTVTNTFPSQATP